MSVNTRDVSSDETLSLPLRILKTHYIIQYMYTIINGQTKRKHPYRYIEKVIYYILVGFDNSIIPKSHDGYWVYIYMHMWDTYNRKICVV